MESALRAGAPDAYGLQAAIDLATASGVPDHQAAILRDRCAHHAACLARADVEAGRFDSAYATVAEALRAPISSSARDDLVRSISETLR